MNSYSIFSIIHTVVVACARLILYRSAFSHNSLKCGLFFYNWLQKVRPKWASKWASTFFVPERAWCREAYISRPVNPAVSPPGLHKCQPHTARYSIFLYFIYSNIFVTQGNPSSSCRWNDYMLTNIMTTFTCHFIRGH